MRARCLSHGARGIVPGSARGAILRRSSPLCRPWRCRLYATMTSPVQVSPFTIQVPDRVLSDLRARIRSTRWPPGAPGAEWGEGTDLEYLKHLLGYWADGFDWRARERELNRFKHFRVEIDGVAIHFVHERARQGSGVPIILTHGWPSAFTELLPLVPLLTEPHAHGIDGPALQRHPVHGGADAGIRAERFPGRPRRLDPREVAIVGRHQGFSGAPILTRLPPHAGDALLGHGDDHDVDARLLRQSLARDHARARRLRPGPDRHRQLHRAARLRRRSAARVGGASVRRPPLDANALWWALRAGRGARATGPRHRDLFRDAVTRLSTRAGSARH